MKYIVQVELYSFYNTKCFTHKFQLNNLVFNTQKGHRGQEYKALRIFLLGDGFFHLLIAPTRAYRAVILLNKPHFKNTITASERALQTISST